MALTLQESVWTTDPQRHVPFDMSLSHANGLRMKRPVGYIETEVADGYILAEIADGEIPMEIRIQALDEKPGAYRASERPLSWLSGRAKYVVQRRWTPELGDFYELKAFRRERNAWLLITATVKDAMFEPEFEVAWAVLDQAQMVAPDPKDIAPERAWWARLETPKVCRLQAPWQNQNLDPDGRHSQKPAFYNPRC